MAKKRFEVGDKVTVVGMVAGFKSMLGKVYTVRGDLIGVGTWSSIRNG